QHEAVETVSYLDAGGRPPVWFVGDPKRADIDLIQHDDPQRYRWALPYPVLIDGTRPDELDWYRLDAPEWWLGPGWALTPELAGVFDADRRGLAFGPIDGHLSPAVRGGVLVIGGRNLEAAARPRVDIRVDGRALDSFELPPGAFVRAVRLPADGAGSARLVVTATPPSRIAIEQFDASASRMLMAYGEGWHEPELVPATGLRWRWISDHGDL